jgi:3-oxoacyl-[acyl-carrier protein] reductase
LNSTKDITMSKKLALVFGGSRGIGAASVAALQRDGFDVAYTYVSSQPEGSTKAYHCDVEDPASVAEVFAQCKRDFGAAPHTVVVNAGINVPPGPLAAYPVDDFRRVVEVNLVGAFNLLAEAARQVPDGGNIIALTTSMVRGLAPNFGPYVATKAAVESLVRALSRELAPRNVRVNAVAPGPVDTDLFRKGKTPEAIQRSAAMSPFNRVGKPEEVAEVIAFLASDKASWVHGQVVQPNGGMV